MRCRQCYDGHGRRGSVYLATLGAAMIVVVIGLSALLVIRCQTRATNAGRDSIKADLYAQSAVDIALSRIAGDPDWRGTYTNDTWTDDETVGEMAFGYKLVDERDGVLSDDPAQPVRLYTKAEVNDAVRLYSVSLRPILPDNLLDNANMEDGVAHWTDWGYCTLESSTDDPHSASACLFASNRSGDWAGPNQYVTAEITSGQTYYTEAWVKMDIFSEDTKITLRIHSADDGTQWFSTAYTAAGTGWTRITGTITPTWTGTLDYATWRVETKLSDQSFYVDDALFIEGTVSPPAMLMPQTGTWRREVLP